MPRPRPLGHSNFYSSLEKFYIPISRYHPRFNFKEKELSRGAIPKILKNCVKMNFPRQIPILFLVLSSMYNTGTAWPVRVSANESCITPLHLLRVKCMYLVLERNINISYINESNSKYLRLSHPPTIQMVRPNVF